MNLTFIYKKPIVLSLLKIVTLKFTINILTILTKLQGFFFQKTVFSLTWSLFHDSKTTHFGVILLHKKLILYSFSKMIIKNVILKTCFKNLFKKTDQK